MGERTGSRIFRWVWSYVLVLERKVHHIGCGFALRASIIRNTDANNYATDDSRTC
ncbi:hypothetical protein CLIM01_10108 [Colletotrichum limetticola]|uniref:Uncharacterized protein n=1 Tax=Colletotrichum limetticola TaxID=1209924 RepID=A0ABQ9PKJ1_9PEZI|nr:hypothetical protein CLIM01_10108 [Colletotrichum limetticola]